MRVTTRKYFLAALALLLWALAPAQAQQQVLQVCIVATNPTTFVPCNNAPSGGNAGYPAGAVPVTASQTFSASTSAAIATIPAVAGKTAYLCGWTFSSGGMTSATQVTATISGTVSGTLNFAYNHPSAGQGVLGATNSPYCIPASGPGVAIVATLPGGTGGASSNIATSSWGFYL